MMLVLEGGRCILRQMIILYTDFGPSGPYTGQMKAVLAEKAAEHAVIDLLHNAPACDPMAAGRLLASLIDRFATDCVFLCVVDPGVGGKREPGILKVAEQWFVGPDNGLFEWVIRHALERGRDVRWWDITWRPENLSVSFHGRDIFAPIAARLANGDGPGVAGAGGFEERDIDLIRRTDWPDDMLQVIYIDDFGNVMTGISARKLDRRTLIFAGGDKIPYAETFSGVTEGAIFWYENSCNLVEIAVNKGRASDQAGLQLGDLVSMGSD